MSLRHYSKQVYSLRTITASGAPPLQKADPYWDFVVLAMHMDGFNDEKGHLVSAYGNVAPSAAQAKFGGKSMYFNGSGDYLTIPDSDEWFFGANDLTVEFWYYADALYDYCVLLDHWTVDSVGNRALQLYATGSYGIVAEFELANSVNIISGGSVITNQWRHVAFVRAGTSIKLYLDGSSIGTPVTSSTSMSNSNSNLCLGAFQDGTGRFQGYIDDLRITNGFARYTENFTPPNMPFPEG